MGCGCGKKARPAVAKAAAYVPPSDPGGKWVVSAKGQSDLTYSSLATAREAAEAVGGRISGG